jgi:hypothetical protein
MAATIHPLSPGSRGQDADDSSACFGATPVGGSPLDDPSEIPAGAPAHLGDLQGAPRFAAVKRYCGDPDTNLVSVGIAQADLADSQPAGHRRVNDHGTDLLRHKCCPLIAVG